MTAPIDILEARKPQIHTKGEAPLQLACEKHSVAGSVSQRACVFCGSRVVLYPISDALHLVHGPIGCAAYTWDIRGAQSSGSQLHRMSFSTDLREKDVIYGGEQKCETALTELIARYRPKAAFVYATCIVGLIGDDLEAVCRRVTQRTGIDVIPVHSEGFAGSKKDGYSAACKALDQLVGTSDGPAPEGPSINILGDFNIAGETWIIRDYYERMGVKVLATITGDGRVDDIRRAHLAKLNVVQCSGSIKGLARIMKEKYDIPFTQVSYFGLEDMSKALYDVAEQFGDRKIMARTAALVRDEINAVMPKLREYRKALEGKRAAVYTGGAFKAFSLVRSLRTLGVKTVIAGSQTGNPQDYQKLEALCDEGTVLLDDTNPLELAKFIDQTGADLLIGGVKERPIAYKLGVAFCDHNHERKQCLAGYVGMENFAQEVHSSVCSPVWSLSPRRRQSAPAAGVASPPVRMQPPPPAATAHNCGGCQSRSPQALVPITLIGEEVPV